MVATIAKRDMTQQSSVWKTLAFGHEMPMIGQVLRHRQLETKGRNCAEALAGSGSQGVFRRLSSLRAVVWNH